MIVDAPGGLDRPALRRCIALSADEFVATHWGRSPLLSRAADLAAAKPGAIDMGAVEQDAVEPGASAVDAPSGFSDLLSADAVDELLSRRGLRTPFLRVAHQGTVLSAGRFTGGGGVGAEIGDQVVDDKILTLYADGATLVLQGLHRIWPPLIDFARRLGTDLGQPLQVNAYLTPPGNQGFATHYDTHDVFVLQVDGRKRWRIHPPVLPDPLERQPWGGLADEVAAVGHGPPALDVVLAPGDALYLPRGWLHAADAQEHRSLHLTVGIRALTRFALVEELLAMAAEDERLRRGLPFGCDVGDPEALAPELGATVAALRSWLLTVSPEALANRMRQRSWPATRPAPIRPLAQLAAAERLSTATRITVRGALRWRLADDAPDHVVLHLTERSLRFPAFCAPALQAVLGGGVHLVGDLPKLDDDADRLVLARRLLREALVVPAD